MPNGQPGGQCFYSAADRASVASAQSGRVILSPSEIAKHANINARDVYVTIRGNVYDVGAYLSIATTQSGNGAFNADANTAFLSLQLTQILMTNLGGDATAQFNFLPNANAMAACMDKLFYKGTTVNQSIISTCSGVNYVLYGWTVIVALFMLTKLILSCCF